MADVGHRRVRPRGASEPRPHHRRGRRDAGGHAAHRDRGHPVRADDGGADLHAWRGSRSVRCVPREARGSRLHRHTSRGPTQALPASARCYPRPAGNVRRGVGSRSGGPGPGSTPAPVGNSDKRAETPHPQPSHLAFRRRLSIGRSPASPHPPAPTSSPESGGADGVELLGAPSSLIRIGSAWSTLRRPYAQPQT